jgi:FeS assembly SUF system protein
MEILSVPCAPDSYQDFAHFAVNSNIKMTENETHIESTKPLRTFVDVQNEAIQVLQTVYDPEIPVNIYELGLIYEVNVSNDLNIEIIMSLTSPFCPAAQSMPAEIKEKLSAMEGVKEVEVKVVFEPPWSQDLMSESAKLQLGFM